MDANTPDQETKREQQRLIQRDANIALGCAFGVALLVVFALLIYLWTL